MSRGRGGGRGGRGGMRGNILPFEVDLDIVDGAEESFSETSEEQKLKQFFPPMAIIKPAPITIFELEQIPYERETQAQRDAGPANTGTKQQNATYDGAKAKFSGELNLFDSMETYTKKRARPAEFKPAEINVKKLKTDTGPSQVRGVNAGGEKRIGLAKKSVKDKLARYDDVKDDDPPGKDDDSVGAPEKGRDDDDAASQLEDNEYDEDDDDDADNDYNAEQYFSGGEGDGEAGGEDFNDEEF